MDWINFIGVLVFPIVGWLWGKLSGFEAQDAKLSTAIDGLNKTTAAIWKEIKELRHDAQERAAKIYSLEQRIKYDYSHNRKH